MHMNMAGKAGGRLRAWYAGNEHPRVPWIDFCSVKYQHCRLPDAQHGCDVLRATKEDFTARAESSHSSAAEF
jgi:hypothetical protein